MLACSGLRVRGVRLIFLVLVSVLFFAALGPPATRAQAVLPTLPCSHIDTTFSHLPTGANTWTPQNSADFQSALDNAQRGDIIYLQAGTTYTGPFTLPNKTTGSGIWVYIVSSAYSQLPAPGQRVAPADAENMPKIVGPGTSPAIVAAAGAHHYRFVGVEISTDFAVTSDSNDGLIYLGIDVNHNNADFTSTSQLPHDITFDRCYIHGTPTGNVLRGIVGNAASLAVIDSYMSEFHAVGADSQAIAVWNGPGPFKIVNNYLSAAGEIVLFGGAAPSIQDLVPSDIEVRGNYFYKPLSWRVGDPSYAGIEWQVKDALELNNAQRVQVDGNVFENNWAEGQNNGTEILFTPRDPGGTAPWAAVEDVAFTRNIVRHVGGGITISAADNLYPSWGTDLISIEGNVFEDVSQTNWGGPGVSFQLVNQATLAPATGIGDLTINHNTAFSSNAYHKGLTVGDSTLAAAQSSDVTITDNILATGGEIWGTGTFPGAETLGLYFQYTLEFRNNVLVGENPGLYGIYAGANFFPASDADVQFVNLAGGDYHLAASSPYKDAATDGSDVGACIDCLNDATDGVTSRTGYVGGSGTIDVLVGGVACPASGSSTTSWGCPIHTAFFGSYGSPPVGSYGQSPVRILREFRDRYLMPTAWGRAFVRFYYRIGPPLAAYIRTRPAMRAIVRAGLMPAIGLSLVLLKTDAPVDLLLPLLLLLPAGLLLGGGALLMRRRAKRR